MFYLSTIPTAAGDSPGSEIIAFQFPKSRPEPVQSVAPATRLNSHGPSAR
jgi:hypothetical protein